MGALGNTPRSTTVVSLEAAKSFAFGVSFLYAATGGALDLTGATLRLVLAQPPRLGGAVLLTETAVLVDAVGGEASFELQAADLALPEAEYPYTITLVTADGYSTPVDKGLFDIRANPDASTTNVYTGVNPAQALTVKLGTSNHISVQVTSLQGPRGLQGEQGTPGTNGTNGIDGPSAYQVAVDNGFVGTEAAWLASLEGPQGIPGPKGDPGTGSVDSVNGYLGPDIVLGAADVGAIPTAGTRTINNQTGTAYTLALGDAGPTKWLRLTNAAATALTVPPNSSVAFPVGTVVEGNQGGAGQVTITPGAGVTVNAVPGLKIAAQYGTFALLKVATDTWLAMGRLST